VIVSPEGMSLVDWSRAIANGLRSSSLVPVYSEDQDWRDWASGLCSIPNVASQLPPSPRQYDDWRTWAEQFNLVVPSYL
jgi:hypothetical protein